MGAGETTQGNRKGVHLEPYRFQPGNPGRPKGSRNKLAEQVFKDILEDWEAGGVEAIRAVREKNPGLYLRVIATLLPKEFTFNAGGATEDMDDDELRSRLRRLHGHVAAFLDGGIGANGEPIVHAGSSSLAESVHPGSEPGV